MSNNFDESNKSPRNVPLVVNCKMCDKPHTIWITQESLVEYLSFNSRHIQDIFPYLSSGERELLISRICETCFDKLFEDEE